MSAYYCFPAIFSKDQDDNLNLRFVDIDEAYTFASNNDYDELAYNARDVLQLSLEGRIEDGEKIPEPTKIDKIKVVENETIILVTTVVKGDRDDL